MGIKCGVLALAIFAVAGCSGNPPRPTEAMTRAQTSIDQADQAEARRFDPANLDSAKEKLSQAKTAADKGDTRNANRLAEQAELDADLAAARGRSASAAKAAEEVRASTETLRAEIVHQTTK